MKTYKPYKKNPNLWSVDGERSTPDKRVEVGLEIGTVIDKDDRTSEITSQDGVIEYVYKDVYEGMMKDFREYDVRITLGRSIQMVVTYANRIVPYNKKCESIIKNIQNYLSGFKKSDLVKYATDVIMAELNMKEYSGELKEVTENFNAEYSVTVPVEMMGAMIKEVVAYRKPQSEQEENLMYMDYSELLEDIARCMEEKDKEGLKNVKSEIFYRVLVGDLVPKIV